MAKHNDLGARGGQYAKFLLSSADTEAQYTGSSGDRTGDIRVIDLGTGEFVRIEVKTARRDVRGKYQACLKRQVKARVCTDVWHADFVLMLCMARENSIPVLFLIPSDALRGMKNLAISGNPYSYSGKWSSFKVRPDELMPRIFGRKLPNALE